MIFKNKLAYIVKDKTRNNTNTKNYNLLNGDFIFEATFRPFCDGDDLRELCVIGRTGFNMGIYSHGRTVKFTWFRVDDEGFLIYDDLFFGQKIVDEEDKTHEEWWMKWIKKNAPKGISEITQYGLMKRWGFYNYSFPLNPPTGVNDGYIDVDYTVDGIKNDKVRNWVKEIDEYKNKTSSSVTEIIKVKVIKEKDVFHFYVNDIFYSSKKTGKIYDYSNQTLFIGVGNPYTTEWEPYWYFGDIYEIKVYHDSVETDDNLYCWYDFENNSRFKTFDKSGNGNHGEIFIHHDVVKQKNEEFNKLARPAKIIFN